MHRNKHVATPWILICPMSTVLRCRIAKTKRGRKINLNIIFFYILIAHKEKKYSKKKLCRMQLRTSSTAYDLYTKLKIVNLFPAAEFYKLKSLLLSLCIDARARHLKPIGNDFRFRYESIVVTHKRTMRRPPVVLILNKTVYYFIRK